VAVEGVLCRVHDFTVAAPLHHVAETMRRLPVIALAGAPPCVSGIARIRGVPTLVLDVGLLVGANPAAATRFVTLRGERPVALAVDAVLGVGPLPSGEALPMLRDASVIAAIAARDRELAIVLETLHLVPAGVTW
jgi:purine-binding chemotaxis protein CheW